MWQRLKSLAGRLRLEAYKEREDIRRAALTFAAGLGVLLLMQVPVVERSFLGDLDRQMLDTAFKLRADIIRGEADPVLFLDIDDRSLAGEPDESRLPVRAPPATASRGMVADLLEFVRTAPPESQAQVVLVDVDLATPTGDAEGEAKLHRTLEAWARTPTAPPLIVARESFPPSAVGVPGGTLVLPVTPYDDVVTPAPNIFWGSVKMLADKEGVIREFLPFECVRTTNQVQVNYSAVLLAYGFLQQGELPRGSHARRWVERAEPWCAKDSTAFISHGERINYHLSLERSFEGRVWPDLPEDWSGFEQCGRAGDPAIFRQLSAADVVQAGPDASRSVLCRRIVIIGGTNTPASDFQPSPLDEMAGPMILANSIRGLQLSGGGLRQINFALQVLVLLVVSLAISLTFNASRAARQRFATVKQNRKGIDPREAVQLIALNPVVLNWALAIAAHIVGIGLLMISLDLSFWGYLSAPAIGAAITETIQEFADD